jgi:rhodanese-related sulfurtransferase
MIVRGKLAGAATAVVLALGLLAAWAPAASRRAHALENQAVAALARRDVHISPAELATLMHDRQVALALFDLRAEPAFNRFHLTDARRLTPARLPELRALPERTVKVLMAEAEAPANRAYQQLTASGIKQVYILAGGMQAWLDLFAQPGQAALPSAALGGRHPASYPDLEHISLPRFDPKVKRSGGAKKSAGCGG